MKTIKTVLGIFAVTLALAAPLHAQTFLNGGLVAFYPFNGDANDASGFLNNPFVNTAAPTADRFGKTNAAYYFDSTQQISYNSAAQLEAITNLTATCWIQTTNYFSGFHGLVCKMDTTSSGNGFQVGVYHSRVEIQVDQSNYTSNRRINDGDWHAISVTFDNSNTLVSLYIDGQLDSTFGTPVATLSVTNQLNLGVERYDSNFYFGALDEVRLFNRVLTPTEISQLYAVESAEFSLPYFNLNVAISASVQNSNAVVGSISNTYPLLVRSIATKNLLNILANDAFAEGSWPSNSFPKNTTLDLAGHSFVVLDNTNILLNVSDKLSFQTGDPKISSGKISTVTGLASPSAQTLQIAGVTFDDTFATNYVNLKFYLNGVLARTLADSTPNNGAYIKTLTLKLTTAAGDGFVQGIPFICTGTIEAVFKTALHL